MTRARRSLALAALAALVLTLPLAGRTAATAPGNDNFADISAIEGLPYDDTADLTDATLEADEPMPCALGNMDRSVWYTYTPVADGAVTVEIGSVQDGVTAAVYGPMWSSPATFADLTFNGWCIYGVGPQAAWTEYLYGGATYAIQITVDPTVVTDAYLGISVYPPPPPDNDDVANAATIDALPFGTAANLTSATREEGEASFCNDWPSGSVWYTYTPSADGTIWVRVGAEEGSTAYAAVYLPGMSPINVAAVSGPICTNSDWDPQALIPVTAGETYLIQLTVNEWSQLPWAYLWVEEGPPLLEVSLSFDAQGTANRISGGALLTGTVTCSTDGSFWTHVTLRQRLNRFTVASGEGGVSGTCGTEPTPFAVWVYGDAPFVNGYAEANYYVEVYSDMQSTWADGSGVVRLRNLTKK